MAYNLLKPVHLITNGDMSGNITSNAVEIRYQDNIGIEVIWTGTPTGSFGIEVSINHMEDINGNIISAGTWIPLPLNPSISASGSASSALIELNQMTPNYMRVTYTAASGSGTLNCYVMAKGV